MHDFRAIRRFQCKARYEGNGSPLVEHRNVVVETLYCSRRAGLQAIHAALDVVDLEQPNPPTSALPEWLLIPAENVHFEVTWVYTLIKSNDVNSGMTGITLLSKIYSFEFSLDKSWLHMYTV